MSGFDRLKSILRREPDPIGVVEAAAILAPPGASADPDWILAKVFIKERLDVLRRELETQGLLHGPTEGLRGAILELEGVLNFRKPSKMA